MDKIIVTGCAGFIGFHLSKSLLDEEYEVLGIDNINDYYDPVLKNARLEILKPYNNFTFQKVDISDRDSLKKSFQSFKPKKVVNLAAQAGVRYSIENPFAYLDSNLVGFLNIIELCRRGDVEGFIYASSSSVYGGNEKIPFSVDDRVDKPISLYGATKRANELIAYSYSHLYGLQSTGLRYFTVYGPWGRPDMALFLFTKAILASKPIDVYNHGEMERDFTYIDDIVEGVCRIIKKAPEPDPEWSGSTPDPASSSAPYRLYNIGSNKPVKLMDYIREIEKNLGKQAQLNPMPMQDGDFLKSHANVDSLVRDFGYTPKHSIESGIKNFIEWYLDYYPSSKNI